MVDSSRRRVQFAAVVLSVGAAVVALLWWRGGNLGAEREGSAAAAAPVQAPAEPRPLPELTEDGRLVRPAGWEAWVLAGTSMGLTYNQPARQLAPGEPPGMFLNVYVQPWAYEAFMRDGEFPEGTMFVLAGSRPVAKADPARGGFYQGDLHLMEVHLKREGIDPTGWAFYSFDAEDAPAEKLSSDARCYECHAANGAHDNVFTQFYPRIRERLGEAGGGEG